MKRPELTPREMFAISMALALLSLVLSLFALWDSR